MRFFSRSVFVLFLISLSGCVSPTSVSKQVIQSTKLSQTLDFFAHSEMEGRGTENFGCDVPSLYLAHKLWQFGFEPLGESASPASLGSFGQKRNYFQPFQFVWDKQYSSRNVLGYIEGKNKNEFIIIGAHYDHLGKDYKGNIFHGADDNGSGSVALLSVAQSFSKLFSNGTKPNRSILIAFWGAEEWGLVGSDHFVNHPPPEIKIENIVTVINMDMVGRDNYMPGKTGILSTPEGEKLEVVCPELHKINKTIGDSLKLDLVFVTHDKEGGFHRSDQFSFFNARKKGQRIPVLFYTTGLHKDYHQPTDTSEKIDYQKLEKISKLIFLSACQIDALPNRPHYQNLKEDQK